MHRKPILEKLIKEWFDLELPSTCTAMDNYSSMQIIKCGDTLVFISKTRGVRTYLAEFDLDTQYSIVGSSFPAGDVNRSVSLILYALEQSIERN